MLDRAAGDSSTRRFLARVSLPDFPCVGAKSALAHESIGFIIASSLLGDGDDEHIVTALQAFAAAASSDAVFLSQAVLFPATPPLDELRFEAALWQRLHALHVIDARSHAWDPSISPDPDSPHFSMSIGGRGFYVIGLHPAASRAARRFECAALVFNLHSQFEALRADGRYEKLRDAITERDMAFSGSSNPMLATHGVDSEARQYSGRSVGPDWRCPFSATSKGTPDGQ